MSQTFSHYLVPEILSQSFKLLEMVSRSPTNTFEDRLSGNHEKDGQHYLPKHLRDLSWHFQFIFCPYGPRRPMIHPADYSYNEGTA